MARLINQSPADPLAKKRVFSPAAVAAGLNTLQQIGNMKKTLLLLLTLCIYCAAEAQQYRFEELVSNEIVQLNSASRIGGKTRDYLPVQIPAGAIGLVYSMTAAHPNQPVEKNFSLVAGMITLFSTGNSVLSSAVSRLPVPEGTETADAYCVTDYTQVDNFLRKGGFTYIPDYSRTNRSSTKVFVPLNNTFPARTIYLCLRNPSALNKISITINAVAVFTE
jgi:hypothetical protein